MQGICSDITEKIIGSAYTVWNSLGAGFLEKVYEKALLHEISKSGTQATAQHPLKVYYDGVVVGEYFVDLFVENSVIVELKAGKAIEGGHLAQTMNYLKATCCRVGLIINFSPDGVQVKRIMN